MKTKTATQHKHSILKGSDNMKKLSALFLSMVMLIGSTISVSAARPNQTTKDTITNFYVQRSGVQMDTEGNVTGRDSTYFTPSLFKTDLTSGKRATDYSIVYKAGEVSSDDVIAETIDKPTDSNMLAQIKAEYEPKGGQILSSNGNVVSWNKFNTDNYEIRWYVLKYHALNGWHVDGVIVEKETQKPIEIPLPDEPGYVKPDDIKTEFTSNYAYIFGYTDSTMAPNEKLIRAEVSQMIYRLVKQNDMLDSFVYKESATPAFDDIDGQWFRSGIEYLNTKGSYAENESVYPYVTVTRGETFKLLCLGLNFIDNSELLYDEYAAILYNAGYIKGDENGNLNVDKFITRAEFCSMYNTIIGRENALLITADGEEITADTYGITDLDEGEWYYDVMLRATSAYDNDGYVDIELRNHRNILDDYQ